MNPRAAAALASLLAAAAGGAAHADIYKLVEPDGTVRFTNVPDNPRYRLYMRERGNDEGKSGRARVTLDRRQGAGFNVNAALAARPYHEHVLAAAKAHDLDPALIHAVIAAESNYRAGAVSPKGAIGLMQVMPDTGARFGVSAKALRDPQVNIEVGTRYLAWLIDRFNGDLQLALAGYNAGELAVVRHGNRIPPYAETRAYVPRVLNFYDRLRGRQYASAER